MVWGPLILTIVHRLTLQKRVSFQIHSLIDPFGCWDSWSGPGAGAAQSSPSQLPWYAAYALRFCCALLWKGGKHSELIVIILPLTTGLGWEAWSPFGPGITAGDASRGFWKKGDHMPKGKAPEAMLPLPPAPASALVERQEGADPRRWGGQRNLLRLSHPWSRPSLAVFNPADA